MKKLSKVMAAIILFATLTANTFAFGPFSDLETDHQNLEAILYTQDMGIIDGYPDGTFRPNGSINRAELMKMVVEMVAGTPDSGLYKNCFPDVKTDWYAPYVCLAKENGWVDGYPDGYFRPANYVNRAEALKIILNAATNANLDKDFGQAILNGTYASDVDENAWYYPYFEYAAAGNLLDRQHVTTFSTFSYNYYPAGNMSRKEVAETIFRYRTMENGLAQYNAMYSPYGYSMDYGIRNALAENHEGVSVDEIELDIINAEAGHAYGETFIGGIKRWFYANIYEGGWRIAVEGNGVLTGVDGNVVYCDILEASGFSERMMEGCEDNETWQSYVNEPADFDVQYPNSWNVVSEDVGLVAFAPEGMNYDFMWAINWQNTPDEMEEQIDEMGDQFDSRQEERTSVSFNGIDATLVTVTATEVPDWSSKKVFFENNGKLFIIMGGSGVGEEDFEEFYTSFEFSSWTE